MPNVAVGRVVAVVGVGVDDRRTAAGLTQTALARRAHLTLTYVGRLEAARAAPGIDTVGRLADALETTIHELLPLTIPPETFGSLKERARGYIDQLFQIADPDVTKAVTLLLGQLADGALQAR
jgi:transcriptional regulator with XRE-family HTH domain